MRKLTIPFSPLHLRKLLLPRCFSACPNSLTHNHLPIPRSPSIPRPGSLSSNAFSSSRCQWFSIRNFSSETDNAAAADSLNANPEKSGGGDGNPIVKLLSDELQKNPDAEPLPLPKRLDLSFSHVKLNPALLLSTLNISPDAGRMALDLLKWAKSRPGFEADDEVYSYFVDYFGRRKDFKATHELLVDARGVTGIKSFEVLVDRMVRAGRPSQTVALFERMEKDYEIVRNLESLKLIVSGLSERGYASYAEKMVKSLENDFVQNSSPREIEKSFKILQSLNPSQEFLISTVIACPRVLDLAFLENWKLGFKQLGLRNISSIASRNVLELASKFELSANDVSGYVKCLKGLGFSEATIVRVLEAVPTAITLTDDELRSKVEFLMGIGIRRSEFDRVIGLVPRVLTFGVEKRLKPLLDEFVDLGFSLSVVRREVVREPKILGLEIGELSQCLEMLRSLKCRSAIKKDILRDGEFRAGYRVKLRVDCLRKHGLISRDAFTVLWKEPRVIVYDIEDIENKIEFLVNKMKFDIECLAEVPEYLGVNFDNQTVPRFSVIDYLRSRGGLGDEVSLSKIVKMSRLKFYNMYVKPYPECENIYGRFARRIVVQNQHPVGMWKLFRPQKFPKSEEDIKNIKLFVGSFPK